MEKLTTIKGVHDVYYPESARWQQIIGITEKVFEDYGYSKIFLPVMEYTELFARSIGEDTDIVGKEMYAFKDRKSRDIALRPEGTAGAVRAMIANRQLQGNIREKIYYFGPMFRYERPQEGRYRQFYQLGCEVFGSRDSETDAEIAEIAVRVVEECGIKDITLKINSVGCEDCRKHYRKHLKDALSGCSDELCEDCNRRLETNTLRILDCKNNSCQELYQETVGGGMNPKNKIKSLSDCLCGNCNQYYGDYKTSLKERGIEYSEEKKLVRGLDYYTGPVFELEANGMAVFAGGRYDGLVQKLGGPDVPACGWALGLERLAALSGNIEPRKIPEVYLAYLGDIEISSNQPENLIREKHIPLCKGLAAKLREKGISVEEDYSCQIPDKKYKMANKKSVDWMLIYGTNEAEEKSISIRNMKTREEEMISLEDIDGIIKRIR